MNKTLATLREELGGRIRRETVSVAVLIVAMVAVMALTVTDAIPSADGNGFASSFVGGFIMGLLACATVLTVKQLRAMRRALRDDAALRELHAKENDELDAHLARETARTFVQLIPPLSAVIVVVAALVGVEAVITAVATILFLCTALLLTRLYYKHQYSSKEDAE
ncbi:hypothetical protein [uncultured Enorma sp.]|uniref:hypothetical protein n=1 Tax=uncultured Enorma sp. TaxID=1714346 RepID=UPI002804B6EC|nr:hypothetical protein [uncultured Enorma sp.]